MFSFSWPLLLQPMMASEKIIWCQPYEREVIYAYINNGLLGMNIFETTEHIIVFLKYMFLSVEYYFMRFGLIVDMFRIKNKIYQWLDLKNFS